MPESPERPVFIARTRIEDLFKGLKPKTLANLASQGRGPRFFKKGRLCFYRVSEIEAYIMENEFGEEG